MFEGCIPSSIAEYTKMVSDGRAGVIIAFATCYEQDIYAHRVEELLPDLTLNRIKAPRMLTPDKPITVRVTIGNQGEIDVSGSYTVSLLLDGDLLKEEEVVDAPVAGAETVVTLSGVRIPALSAGNHSLEATADMYDDIPESNEKNNMSSIKVKTK